MIPVSKIFKVLLSAVICLHICTVSIAQWLDPLKLSIPRARLTAAAAGGKVYFAGGYNGTTQTRLDVYDTLTETVTAHAQSLSVPRCDLASVYNPTTKKIYFAGGTLQNGQQSAVVDVFDVTTNSFAGTLPDLPAGRAYMCAATVGTKIIFAGGAGGGTWNDDIYIYDTSNPGLGWQTALLSEGRDQIAVQVIGNNVIMAGGNRGSGYSDNIDILDAVTHTVTQPVVLSSRRTVFSAAKYGNKILFAGGWQEGVGVVSTVDVLDMSGTPTMLPTTQLSYRRMYLTGTTVGPYICFAGGVDNTNAAQAQQSKLVDIFDIRNGVPTGPTKIENLSVARQTLSSASLGTRAVFAGGVYGNPGVYSDAVDIYSTETVAPTTLSVAPKNGAKNVAFDTVLVITFSEKIRRGTGKIVIKEGNSIKYEIDVNDPDVVISGNKVTIKHDGFLSSTTISVGFADGVFIDYAGNKHAGIASSTWSFEIPTYVTVTTHFDETFIVNGSDHKVSIEVSDDSNIQVVFKSRGISEPDAALEPSSLTDNGKVYEKEFNDSDLSDPIGVYYEFTVTDVTGRNIVNKKRTYLEYTDEGPTIPYSPGGTRNDYRIISVPLKLKTDDVLSVFDELKPYDTKRWRLYEYAGGKNREYQEAGSFTKITPGKGYWLLTTYEDDIKPGPGTTVPFSDETTNKPYSVTLNPGWTLIGNPYMFDISWAQVLASNTADDKAGIVNEVQSYSGGNELSHGDVISKYRGAFVRNTGSGSKTLFIPTEKTLGGRVASRGAEVDLSNYNWSLALTLTDGELTNSTGGIGMNKNATLQGEDIFDRVPAPMPSGIGMFKMTFSHPELGYDFVKEVVPTADAHVWDLNLDKTSNKPLTLSWDHASIKESDKQLLLVDLAFGTIRDMKTEGSYTIPPSTSTLKVIFGPSDFVGETLDELLPFTGAPYPNPAEEQVSVPFHIPSKFGKMNVNIRVFDSQGNAITTLANGEYEQGSHVAVWNTSGKSGLYLIHMKVGTDRSRWAKVVVK